MRKLRNILAATAISVVLAGGCYSGKPLPKIRFQQCSVRRELPEMRVGVEPIETRKECKDLFGSDIVEDNMLPFYLWIENNSEGGIKIIGGFNFYDFSGVCWKQLDWVKVAEEQHRKEGLETILVFPAPLKHVFYKNAQAWNKKADESVKEKMIKYNAEIRPYSAIRGFVVFESREKIKKRENFYDGVRGGEISFSYKDGNGRVERFKIRVGDNYLHEKE